MPITSLAPAMPAIAPLTSAAPRRRRPTLIPANPAASGLSPAARSLSPVAVRPKTNHATTISAIAITNPRCSRDSTPAIGGSSALAAIRSDSGNIVSGLRHGPLSSPVTTSSATGLRRSVVTTSSIPSRTRSSAGTSAQTAPPSAPRPITSGIARPRGSPPTNVVAAHVAATAPRSSCPSAPMFQ